MNQSRRMMNRIFPLAFIALLLISCTNKETEKSQSQTFPEKLESLPDSIQVKSIVIRNLFKSQILAHQGENYDTSVIIKKVYQAHQALWDQCYGMIFGPENAPKFTTSAGMIDWNKTLYPENKAFFDQQAAKILNLHLDSLLHANLQHFETMVPHPVKAEISILFTPITGIFFGGCANDQFALELNYEDEDISYLLEKGLPHELSHLAYEPFREDDPDKDTALRQTIDEGFACYFTWLFFNKEIPQYEAVENMTEANWQWYLEHEKALYTTLKPYFSDESGNNPLLRNDQFELFKDAPKSLNYWLGFRIIEKYVEKHGPDSWRDIYQLDVQEVLEKSGYEKYVENFL